MAQNLTNGGRRHHRAVSYNKWGYIFLIPFFVVYIIFNLIPLGSTIYHSLFEYYKVGRKWIGPNFIGFGNYVKLFSDSRIFDYGVNTMIMWVIGFIPQILVSLLLASWFSDTRFRLKGAGFFKTVIYLPNLIMAAAFAMMFYALFNSHGAITGLLVSWGWVEDGFNFFDTVWGTRGLVGLMNFLMWFGNTTILLMAGMMGIDPSIFEAAEVDGASATKTFFRITLPLLRPITIYVIVTSLIGGLQMFDIPQILTSGTGEPMRKTMTLIMFLNKHLYSKNYGMAGALSVVLLIITGALSFGIFKFTGNDKLAKKG